MPGTGTHYTSEGEQNAPGCLASKTAPADEKTEGAQVVCVGGRRYLRHHDSGKHYPFDTTGELEMSADQ
jgi:hypothetical protein